MIKDERHGEKKDYFLMSLPCAKESTESKSLLHHKTSRRISDLSGITGRRCDICLEFEKYSPKILIECAECGATCHGDCYANDCRAQTNFSLKETTSQGWICFRCTQSKIVNQPIQNFRCGICGGYDGIIQKLNQCDEYFHNRCLRFISEAYSAESMDFSIQSINKISVKNTLRKWRQKNMCKTCKEKDFNGKHVIKCANTKCKSYFHIPCAITKNMIFSLDFQYDYYGFCAEGKKKVPLPFYCTSHNKNIAESYKNYTQQLDRVLSETEAEKKEYDELANSIKDYRTEDETKEDLSQISNFPRTNCENIYNLHHPEFNFDSSPGIRDTVIEEELMEASKAIQTMPQKPRYQNEDSLTFNLCENMNTESLSCMNSLHMDIEQNCVEKTKGSREILNNNSENAISEIKDLKAFFLTIVSNYTKLDTPLEEP